MQNIKQFDLLLDSKSSDFMDEKHKGAHGTQNIENKVPCESQEIVVGDGSCCS